MSLALSLPAWLDEVNAVSYRFEDDETAMAFAVALSRRNVEDGGGPFAALVLSTQGDVVAAGVNRVVSSRASILHAEMLALLLAQQRMGTHDLSAAGRFTLVTTCAPCAMCLGAIPWSGIARVVCGARGEDAERIGFDEGDKPARWQQGLRRRGILLREDVCRDEVLQVLGEYRQSGRPLY
ncbi:MAG: nucleoside deaminase [Gammaproteobacteria bacterium]